MEKKIKVCKKCGRSEPDVKFTVEKSVCNQCRHLDNKSRPEYEWKEKNRVIASVYAKGKDPCVKCRIEDCSPCIVYHAKKRYLVGNNAEVKNFIKYFLENMLDFIHGKL